MKKLLRFRPDVLITALIAAAIIATFLPASGRAAEWLNIFTQGSVAFIFFLHGARLLPRVVMNGFANWRLHLTILACSFVLFPLLALPLRGLVPEWLPSDLYVGFVFLCILPSTIQSSISFTSIAGGNVPAAVCAASASNMLGVVATPALAMIILGKQGGINAHAIESIMMQLLAPFALGQVLQRWIGNAIRSQPKLVGFAERISIVAVAYLAFSNAIVGGVWKQVDANNLVVMLLLVVILLAFVLVATHLISRLLGFNRENEIALVFCGSKKSMGSGLPMANIIFAGQTIGLIVLPMMIYHQIQLIVCAILARAFATESANKGISG
ncbi:bile acid:sodium symporter family protein [Microvirga puerhi]|uniref:Bile acid:sodium symporter n=1 Tax=Microvirga puerhi TaxID=2876078 RepID=A0ABS7VVU0_9HYPH|nr:bile acid:sodium symporter family protein [Microvirga puerhi]MBZ6078983.1 bile acid:sodium symporter [Microvirga puerhi]